MTSVGRTEPSWGGAVARAEDAVVLLVLVFATPFLILLIGMPIVLCVRAVIELLSRL